MNVHPTPPAAGPEACVAPTVRELRQVLLWPLRLMPVVDAAGRLNARPWRVLRELGAATPWRELVDEYTGDVRDFHERHYQEFVAFLPVVQRFLYGEGRRAGERRSIGERNGTDDSPMRVFRRDDLRQLRVQLDSPLTGLQTVTLDIVHLDLYFFYDVDVVLLNLEVAGRELPLPLAQELMYRLGRAYPPGWDASGQPLHGLLDMQWLDGAGQVVARSDAQQREDFLAHVAEHRAPRLAADWAAVLQPLVGDHSEAPGALRLRQIEYYRMPLLAWLALDRPQDLRREDFIRLALVSGAGDPQQAEAGDFPDFEARHCYDRFWRASGAAPHTRYLCSGHALVVVGSAGADFYTCADRGVLAQFRHQHFLVFLIAHFQKAALLMFNDRLVEALKDLQVMDAASVRRFKRAIRASFEGFLRFTHRYWFQEVSEQAHVRALFQMTRRQLGTDALYTEVKERIADMSDYLEADSLRRQANTVVRLTVVTIFGLIGTITTGFLGMNLLAEAEAPLPERLGWFAVVFVLTTALTFYTLAKSKRLSDFLDAVTDERLTWRQKAGALWAVWRGE